MAMNVMTSFSAGDVNLTAVMAAENQVMKGYNALTLTHMSDTTVPAIAAGSAIEVNGVLIKSDTETAITGSPSDGVVYIYINGTTPTFTNTAPTWSDSKQGWYGTGGAANYRYVAGMWKATSAYSHKTNIASTVGNNIAVIKITGTISGAAFTFYHGISDLYTDPSRTISCFAMYDPSGAAFTQLLITNIVLDGSHGVIQLSDSSQNGRPIYVTLMVTLL
jgi:hypothetical protein